ncbi:hypothetical protein F8M41_023643 [Gigaspora margarita]|uniref:Uncharacterized protein n=1 Tax=Gigaspora margarita TaxID=4874 RepID=A0A8H4EGM9_GIGMA|nr:hypothetical protein F8M41_023643 [Gigaspora margarita]
MSYTHQDNVTMSYNDLLIELNRSRELLEISQIENQQRFQFLEDQKKEINELLQKAYNNIIFTHDFLEYQRNEIAKLKAQLQRVCDNVITVRNLYDEQLKFTNTLVVQWNSRFDNQQKRIDAIVEIAKTERMLLFEDLEQLIRDSDRFSLKNLKVAVKFIEALVQNNRDNDVLGQKKLFKTAVAIDSIYGAQLSNYEDSLPEGLLFLAFNNKQKGQKNYLDQGSNIVVYHIVTSFVAFNMISQDRIQYTNLPWAFNKILRIEKEYAQNAMPLPRLSEIQKETKVEAENSTVDQLNKPFIFKSYNINEEQINMLTPKISLTQQRVTDPRVNTPEIYIPDPININPNSLANVEKVLVHIEKISGIKDRICKWVVVTCDGVPYHHATKLKENFSG